ncbi:hypothetical protein YC2023_114342 [Brassica napus]
MTFLGIRQKVVGISDEIPTNFFFSTKRYRRTGSSEIRRNRPIPTNFRRFRPSESPCFLVVSDGSSNGKWWISHVLSRSPIISLMKQCLHDAGISLSPHFILLAYKWLESHYAENQFGFSEFQKDYDLVNLQNTVAISKR